jgi:hypothetical protein
VAERRRLIGRLRWHVHELDPECEPKARSLDSTRILTEVQVRLEDRSGVVARLARHLVARCRELTMSIKRLAQEITHSPSSWRRPSPPSRDNRKSSSGSAADRDVACCDYRG